MTDHVTTRPDDLQFDRALGADPTAAVPDAAPSVTCAGCGASVTTEYFTVNGKSVCAGCRAALAEQATPSVGAAPLARAAGLGLVAAIAGAAVYYGVIAITNFEIGIVAILIGYMVGWAVHRGARGRGGRRFQLLAVVLTYWSVGLAYTPLAFKGASEEGDKTAVSADSARTSAAAAPGATVPAEASPAPSPSPSPSPSKNVAPAESAVTDGPQQAFDGRALALAFGMLFVFVFALPVIAIAGSMPGGLISAFIIFLGLQKAWSMTGAPPFEVSGPYRVGADRSIAAD